MHVAAANPLALSAEDIDPALLERERRMHEAWPAFWQDHKDREDPKSARKEWVDWKKANLPELPDTPGTLPGTSSTTAPSGGHA